MKINLSEADQRRIQEAVAEAEGRTSGEIVPYIVPRSGTYEVAVWRAASLCAVVVLFVALVVMQFYQGWGLGWLYASWFVALLALAAGSLGAVAAWAIPSLRRRLAGRRRLERTVHRRAVHAFVDEEVFDTRDRTGILIFISLFERRIEVVGDSGINAKVTPDEWADVVLHIRQGIKNGRLTDGIVDALGLCGALLERSGVEIRPDDTNELSDKIRIRRDD